jgi:segregation and condensation protein B
MTSNEPKVFTPEEMASAAEGQPSDPALDDVAPAAIDAAAEEPETPFEKIVSRGKRMSEDRVRTTLESLLFVTDRPLSLEALHEATGIAPERIKTGLEQLQGQRREGISGIVLVEVAGGWQFRTCPDSGELVRRFLKVKPMRLTRAAVETLAIIAYRQPVTRPEIEDIRGVESGAVLKALLERRLVKILGRKEAVGTPILYGTTREFLEFFALKDLSSLPTLREFHELSVEHQEIVEKEAPPRAEGTIADLADKTFAAKLGESTERSEAALAELEAAIGGAETVNKEANKLLNPPPPPGSEAPLPEGAVPEEAIEPNADASRSP